MIVKHVINFVLSVYNVKYASLLLPTNQGSISVIQLEQTVKE